MTLLSGAAALVGWHALDDIRQRQSELNNSALPLLDLTANIAQSGSNIIITGRFLTQITNAEELHQVERQLQQQMSQLQAQLAQIPNSAQSLDRPALAQLTEQLQQALAALNQKVGQKIQLYSDFQKRYQQLNRRTTELADLIDSQLANAQTALVARSLGLYRQSEPQQLDDLLELDLPQTQRLSELQHRVILLKQQLLDLPYLNDQQGIAQRLSHYQGLTEQLTQQQTDLPDPQRQQQFSQALAELERGQKLFSNRQQQLTTQAAIHNQARQLEQQLTLLNTRLSQASAVANQAIVDAQTATDNAQQQARLRLWLIGITAVLLSLIVVWRLVYRDVIRRIDHYSDALKRLSNGDLSVEVQADGDDELTRLAEAIGAFKATSQAKLDAEQQLRQQHQQLEQTVAERTEALNQQLQVAASARREAETASRAKSTFLATISHEIRTPMNGILGTAELLDGSTLDPKQRHYLAVIRRSGEGLLQILNDVLDYSKIEAGKIELHCQPFELRATINEIIELLSPRAHARAVHLRSHFAEALADNYLGDQTKLRQILLNLIGNAIKFSRNSAIQIRCDGRVDQQQQWLTVTVEDSGDGIAASQLTAIFDPFVQTHLGQSRGGTGLGLPISRRLAEAMGGNLSVRSQLGHGSCFTLDIPLQISDDIPTVTSATPLPQLRQQQILVVEDNPINQLVIEGFLDKLGQQYVSCGNAASALATITAQRFDLALVDINLPDGDGSELQRQLKALQQQQHHQPLPCIAMSAHVFTEQINDFLAAGFDGFLPKPLRLPQLAEQLRQQSSSVAPAPAAQTPTLLDERQLQQDLQILGANTIAQMLAEFIDDSDQLLLALETGADWQSTLHRLKGGASALGLTALSHRCQQLEKLAADLSLIDELIELQQHSLVALQQWLTQA